jgi:hypothetical protein
MPTSSINTEENLTRRTLDIVTEVGHFDDLHSMTHSPADD